MEEEVALSLALLVAALGVEHKEVVGVHHRVAVEVNTHRIHFGPIQMEAAGLVVGVLTKVEAEYSMYLVEEVIVMALDQCLVVAEVMKSFLVWGDFQYHHLVVEAALAVSTASWEVVAAVLVVAVD